MKKYPILLLLLLTLLTAGCSKSNERQPEVTSGTDTVSSEKEPSEKYKLYTKAELLEKYPNGTIDKEPSDFAVFIPFEFASDLRQGTLDKMEEQASIEWLCGNTFTVTKKPENNWSFTNTYQKGKMYRGLIYSDTMTSGSYFSFLTGLENGVFTTTSGLSTDLKIPGVHCSSSIVNSIQTFKKVGKAFSFFCNSQVFVGKPLGDFVHEGMATSDVICKKNGKEKMAECYALLGKGDVIQTYKALSHCRMVKNVNVVYTSTDSGKINMSKSYVECIEQTERFVPTEKEGVETNWFVGHKYTFTDLYADGYLPVTFEEYKTNTAPIPYIALDREPEPEKNDLGCVISTDYFLRFVDVRLKDENGNTVAVICSESDLSDEVFSLRKYNLNLAAATEKGKTYRLIVTAGITHGYTVLYDKTFMKK